MLKDLADIHFPGKKIVLVMDNLNTHTVSTLSDTFAPAEAARLARRIPDRDTRVREAAAWQTHRNADKRPVNWRFTTDDARINIGKPIPLTKPEIPEGNVPTHHMQFKHAVLYRRDLKGGQAKTLPAYGHLKNAMQLRQCRRIQYPHPSSDHRIDPEQANCQLINLRGIRHA